MNENFVDQEEIAAKQEMAKRVAEDWIREYSVQHQGARTDLIKMVSERPRDASDFGELRAKYGIPKPIAAWLALQDDVVKRGHAPSNEKRIMFYLSSLERDAGYWANVVENETPKTKSRLPSAIEKDHAHSYCTSDEGKKVSDWLREDLRWHGPINWSVFGQAHFLPKDVSVGVWLADDLMSFVKSVPKGGGRDYCELRELSPDSRPVRTKADILPDWLVKDRKSVPIEDRANKDVVPLVSSRPFFVGEVYFKKSPLGFSGTYVVSDVLSATDGHVADIPLTRVLPNTLAEGEFVVGLNSAKGPFLFFNQKVNSAVQILMWESFKEAQQEPSAETFFSKNPSGLLAASFSSILGSEERPGHVIIADKEGKYLKGFSSIGKGLIKYFSVEKYTGDFRRVSSVNQVTEMSYKGNAFAILVPEQGNEYAEANKHAVIDCEGWSALLPPPPPPPLPPLPPLPPPPLPPPPLPPLPPPPRADKINSVQDKLWSASDFSSCSNEEAVFLARFFSFVRKCGFEYTPRDLLRFHASIKSGFFTLLGGNPGTGKSSLALLYAKAVAGSCYKNDGTYLRVDVNPGWIEPEDLLGYYSSTAKRFMESSTGLLTFLKTANRINGTRIVCFEELNLAHVEQYFSDFIQQMSRSEGDRFVKIKDTDGVTSIELKKNLRFVGTINFDETTHELSARFYDRCNYLELSPVDAKKLLSSCSRVDAEALRSGCDGEEIMSDQLSSWVSHGDVKGVEDQVLKMLKDSIPLLLALHIAPSPRTIQSVLDYVVSRPAFKTDSDPQILAFDESLAQRILPVYRRPNDRKQIEQEALRTFLRGNRLELSLGLFDRILGMETPYCDDFEA